MQPATPDRIDAIPMLKTLGIRLVESGPDYAVMDVVVDARHANYFGGVHGGLLATLADTVCFFPEPLLPAGRMVTTANLNLNYLKAPALGCRLTARLPSGLRWRTASFVRNSRFSRTSYR